MPWTEEPGRLQSMGVTKASGRTLETKQRQQKDRNKIEKVGRVVSSVGYNSPRKVRKYTGLDN